MKSRASETVLLFLKGLFMGSVDIIPGVSGGTVALITGIYERLVNAIKSINFMFIPYFLKGLVEKQYIRRARENLSQIDFRFLLPLLSGIGIAFLVLARVINRLLADYPSLTFAFFFGLILSSSILISKGVKVNIGTILSFLVGSSFAIFFVGMRGITTDHSLVTLFFSGMITVCAMILPGISGAFIMLFLGQYKYMIHALNYFYVADIGTYLLGGAIGILAFSRFLSYLISKHRAITLSFLMGLMLGALRQPIQEIIAQPQNVYSTLLSGVIGFLVVLSFHVANLKKRKGNVNPCKR